MRILKDEEINCITSLSAYMTFDTPRRTTLFRMFADHSICAILCNAWRYRITPTAMRPASSLNYKATEAKLLDFEAAECIYTWRFYKSVGRSYYCGLLEK